MQRLLGISRGSLGRIEGMRSEIQGILDGYCSHDDSSLCDAEVLLMPLLADLGDMSSSSSSRIFARILKMRDRSGLKRDRRIVRAVRRARGLQRELKKKQWRYEVSRDEIGDEDDGVGMRVRRFGVAMVGSF